MDAICLKFLSFVWCLFVVVVSHVSAQASCDNSKGNYTSNSTYHNNLNTLLSSFYSRTEINYGFYNFSYGQGTDKVYAIWLCRGDITQDKCLGFLNQSRVTLAQQCPNQKEAIFWTGECMLRYSNRSIFGLMENQPTVELLYTLNVTGSVDQFNEALQNLMRNLTAIAASGDSRRKYATGSAPAPNFKTIYGLTQCTPDLSSEDCTKCLDEAISKIPDCCSGKAGGNVLKPSCRIRFDPYSYYGPTIKLDTDAPPPSPSTNVTSSQGKSNTVTRTVIAIAVPVAGVVLALALFCIFQRVRKPRKKIQIKREEDGHEDEITFAESLQFNFDTIRVATNEFADSNKLGEGGFGAVYIGQLSNGQEIAVKRLSRDSGQGDIEFKNEVLLVAKLQHRNLVRLLGFCLEGRERLLVYEFVPNKSLDYFIFDPIKKMLLNWQNRYKIIGGIARGILYLHEDSRLRIIHRDLKASNILLDEDMLPKISDFGLARLVHIDQTQENTSRVVGTYGYMAPEYAIYGQFSAKSDVFSFGVLLLEIVSGKKNSGIHRGENMEDLLTFTWRNWRDGTATNIVDPTLDNGSRDEKMRCIHIGLLCVQENVAARPTMASVVLMLNSYSLTLPVPSEPAFVVDSRTRSLPNMLSSSTHNSGETRSSESTHNSVNKASITEPYPR
ncbi:putative receptor-like protein kinase At4g00960 isoform X1 [Cajanus cajan]|uniref:putative receptor-like protein kinase At4g00960 isoform X1 n=1 Tax=Cajanus cajan TaxID=3821 RepID=UPI0010FB1652|nr:putative receptor-like protein kinase At4g00960 isoform X1 [Cajanus cajan]